MNILLFIFGHLFSELQQNSHLNALFCPKSAVLKKWLCY